MLIKLKVCYLNARSLHRHIEDVQSDLNYCRRLMLIFSQRQDSVTLMIGVHILLITIVCL